MMSCSVPDARPHPKERACEIVPPTRMRVRASRRMRTSQLMRPHASRCRASYARLRALPELACAARLLSMRAGKDGRFGRTKPRRPCTRTLARRTNLRVWSNRLLLFWIVINNENRNSSV